MFKPKRIRESVWLSWMGQWGKLIEAGVPGVDALSLSMTMLGHSIQEKHLQANLQQAIDQLESGKTLQAAFDSLKIEQPRFLELALQCGQANGDLGRSIRTQTAKAELLLKTRQSILQSLLYPCLVLLMSIVSVVLLNQLGTTPNSTQAMTFADGLLAMGALSTPGLLLLRKAQGTGRGKSHSLQFPKHMGLVSPNGPMRVSEFFFVMASQLDAGLDLMQVLSQTRSGRSLLGLQRDPLDREFDRFKHVLHQSLKNGQPFHRAMQASRAPDFMVTQARLAEQTGHIAQCFFTASTVFELQANKRLERLKNWLGPLTLLGSAGLLAHGFQTNLAPLYSNLPGL